MSNKTELKDALKNDKNKLREEMTSLKKFMTDYKIERKAAWKLFKNKMKNDLGRIGRSLDELTISNKNTKKDQMLEQQAK